MHVFMGIRADRPYPATRLTSARWVKEVPVERVDASRLWLTKRHLSMEALLSSWIPTHYNDPIPHVVVYDDHWYLEDGHHRVVREVLVGNIHVLARVFKH